MQCDVYIGQSIGLFSLAVYSTVGELCVHGVLGVCSLPVYVAMLPCFRASAAVVRI